MFELLGVIVVFLHLSLCVFKCDIHKQPDVAYVKIRQGCIIEAKDLPILYSASSA